ncbi:hypothetical protein WN51_01468 [Melipona quadrifasciata]|uniref:Uncharacterized protein n=1 Tax=Melipona quadrifasciata TaxID=166423 RepID=A0A0M8ZYU9_9HYME|nr:hypothetical protein WN51_01468 [Melipona quadrifasciata]
MEEVLASVLWLPEQIFGAWQGFKARLISPSALESFRDPPLLAAITASRERQLLSRRHMWEASIIIIWGGCQVVNLRVVKRQGTRV